MQAGKHRRIRNWSSWFQDNLAGERASLFDRALVLQAMGFGCLRQWQDAVDLRLQFSRAHPFVDVVRGGLEVVVGRTQNDEPEERAILRVKWADREGRVRVASGHHNHAAVR